GCRTGPPHKTSAKAAYPFLTPISSKFHRTAQRRLREQREQRFAGAAQLRLGMKSVKDLEAVGKLRFIALARAHGMRTYEPRQGRKAATAVCSASAVVTLAL